MASLRSVGLFGAGFDPEVGRQVVRDYELGRFLVAGSLGTLVNLAALTMLVDARLPIRWAVVLAISIAVTFKVVLNRRFSFSFARNSSW